MPQTSKDTQIVRYAVVAQVLANVAAGMPFSRAIRVVAKMSHVGLGGRPLRLSVRTLQRWVASYQAGGIDALAPASRRPEAASSVLSEDFLRYLTAAKTADPEASLPEIIRRARHERVVSGKVSRVSVWRAARRLNLPIFASKGAEDRDMHRYAYAHRLQMVLADGKHFRAGVKNRKRVVITVLDDASRFALGAVVGKSESTALFLAVLWKVLRRWGLPECCFLDNGSGFIARDVALVAARLGINIVHGTAGYAEGHGKIERYHRTLNADLLRSFKNNPAIDSDPASLELRVEHYLRHVYNRHAHEELPGNASPEERFLGDELPLRPLPDEEKSRQLFVVTKTRKVSRDNVVKVRRALYEVPRGHAGKRIEVHHHLLDGTVSMLHDGRLVELHMVDLVRNAHWRRARPRPGEDAPQPRPVKTSATMSFDEDHPPLVGDAGDCFEET